MCNNVSYVPGSGDVVYTGNGSVMSCPGTFDGEIQSVVSGDGGVIVPPKKRVDGF